MYNSNMYQFSFTNNITDRQQREIIEKISMFNYIQNLICTFNTPHNKKIEPTRTR